MLGVRVPTRRRWPPTASQQGFSFVEVLVSLVLTSLVVTALAAGLLLLVRVTASTSDSQRLQLAVASYAESIEAMAYLPCGTVEQYTIAYETSPSRWVPPTDIELRVDRVDYWKKVTSPSGEGGYESTCPAADEGSQRLTISAVAGDDEQVAQIVKVLG